MTWKLCLILGTIALPAAAQLTTDQKLQDFRTLTSVYAKRYAPANWKKALLQVDLFDAARWMERVRRSKDDLEYFEIASEYVAQLDDLHSSFRMQTSFFADTGIVVDIYDGKVLIEAVNRLALPAAQFPFETGDELVSVDGKPVDILMDEFVRLRRRGNPSTTRRSAADLLTFRPQSALPRAAELGENAVLVIRRAATGEQETHTVPWRKQGVPTRNIGPVPDVKWAAVASRGVETDYMAPWRELTNFTVSPEDHLLRGEIYSSETGQLEPRRYLLGWGARAPVWTMPQGFQLRKGRAALDFHHSGVYQAEGVRIGYIRFPNFAPQSYTGALAELAEEVAFFKQNTDALVVDVMRNTGGGCYMLDAAAYLIPRPFSFFGEEIRVTADRINAVETSRRLAVAQRAPEWIIRYYEIVLEEMQRAYRENRGLTQSLPACTGLTQGLLPPGFENNPAVDRDGNIAAYDKPLIVLVDEFSTSAGDIFPAMLQDNARGPLVGTRTNGAGGSTSLWVAGYFSESLTSNTNTLVLRREPVTAQGYPQTHYIENVGAHADIQLNYMTRENLMQRGRPFVDAFTKILVDMVKAAQQ
ncbi:MAG: S41 family peptidase [Bryobacteraceae bacterium]|nr:S41 family peptidase [Bryobacteraceae bacterium]